MKAALATINGDKMLYSRKTFVEGLGESDVILKSYIVLCIFNIDSNVYILDANV